MCSSKTFSLPEKYMYSHNWESTSMCHGKDPRTPPPLRPQFFALAAPKDSTFSTCISRLAPPFQKNMILCYFSSKNPFFTCWPVLKAPTIIFSEGRSIRPLFVNPPWHIYVPLSYLSTPTPGSDFSLQNNSKTSTFIGYRILKTQSCTLVLLWNITH